MSDSKTIKLLREHCKKGKGEESAEFEYVNCQIELFGKTVNLVAVRAKPTGYRQSTIEYIVPWILDRQSPNCMRCNVAFSFLSTWRHHCRICGYLVCKSCTKEFRVLSSLEHDEAGSRICNYCTESNSGSSVPAAAGILPPAAATSSQQKAVIEDAPRIEDLAPAPAPSVHVVAKAQAVPVEDAENLPTSKTETSISLPSPSTSSQPEPITTVPEVTKLDMITIQKLSERILAAEQAGESRRTELSDLKQQRLAQFLSVANFEQFAEYQVLSIAERAELQQMSQEKKRLALEQQKQANLAAFLDTHDETSSSLSVKDRAELVTVQAQRERQLRLEQEKQARLSSFLATSSDNTAIAAPVVQRFEEARLKQQSEEKERIDKLKRDPSRSIRITATTSDDAAGDENAPASVLADVLHQEAKEQHAKEEETADVEVAVEAAANSAAAGEEAAEASEQEQDATADTDINLLLSPPPADPSSASMTPVVDLSRLGPVGEELDHRLAQVMSQSLWQALDSPTTDGGDGSSSTQSTPYTAPHHAAAAYAGQGQRLPVINEPSVGDMDITGTDLMLGSDTIAVNDEEEEEDEDEDGNRLSNLDFLSTHSHSQPNLTRPQSEHIAIAGIYTDTDEADVEEDDNEVVEGEDEETKKRRVSSRITTPPPNKRRSLEKNLDLDIVSNEQRGGGEDSFFDSPFVLATPSNAEHKTVAAAAAEAEVKVDAEVEAEAEVEIEEKSKAAVGNGKNNNKKNKNMKNKK